MVKRHAKRKPSKAKRAYSKRKRNTKRKSTNKLRRNKKPSYADIRVPNSMSTVVPDKMRITLPWMQDTNIVGAVNTMFNVTPIRANYPTDPSDTNTSATQDYAAQGLGMWAGIYRRIRVLNVKYSLEFRSTYDDTALDIVPTGYIGAFWGGNAISSMFPQSADLTYDPKRVSRSARFKKVNFTPNEVSTTNALGASGFSSTNFLGVIKGHLNIKKIAKMQKYGALNDGTVLPDVSEFNLGYRIINSPADAPPFGVWLVPFAIGQAPLDGGIATNSLPFINVFVRMEFDCLLSVPVRRGWTLVEDFVGEGNNVSTFELPGTPPQPPQPPAEIVSDLFRNHAEAIAAGDMDPIVITPGYA